MSRLPACYLLTRDNELMRRASGYLAFVAEVRRLDSVPEAQHTLTRDRGILLLVDLRGGNTRQRLTEIVEAGPDALIIALGIPGSDPMHEAEGLGLYAVESVNMQRDAFQSLVRRGLEHLRILRENRMLREGSGRTPHTPPSATNTPPLVLQPDHSFQDAIRDFENIDQLLRNLADYVSRSFSVARAGLFCRRKDEPVYTLRVGLRTLEATRDVECDEGDPFVRWLNIHAHMVARNRLDHITDPRERLMLEEVLNACGAEIIVPLQGRGKLLGWLFVGHHVTGAPFTPNDLNALAEIARHVSTALENALLYEEVTLQKSLAETLLQNMPTGIVAVDNHGVVRWFNDAAQRILSLSPVDVLNQPVEILGSRLADMLRGALAGEDADSPCEMKDNASRHILSILIRQLGSAHHCLGAMALMQDVTQAKMLEEKQTELDRARFWTELAASMSHEIRNPLVAIRTFAQLLPQRFDDDEFRSKYSELVVHEVDRLNAIVDQINDFANPPPLNFKPLDIRKPILEAVERFRKSHNGHTPRIEVRIDKELPAIEADDQALAETFYQLFDNASEALASREKPQITLTAREHRDGELLTGIKVSVEDNACGIPDEIQENVFSPFCTTKARGMGLGLPIVKRTVIDHNGCVDVHTGENGTTVNMILPQKRQGGIREANTDCG